MERPFALFYDNLREVEVMDPDSRYVKIRHLTDEQITSLEGTDAIHVPEGRTQSQQLQILRNRDNLRVEEQIALDSDLPKNRNLRCSMFRFEMVSCLGRCDHC